MIVNLTKKNIVAKNPLYARDLFTRGRGMICRKFDNFDAMVFEKCNCIHTMFMMMNIDVLFIDSENRICEIKKELSPWKLMVRSPQACSVIEMPPGKAEFINLEQGDTLDLNAELCESFKKQLKKEEFLAAAETVVPLTENRK